MTNDGKAARLPDALRASLYDVDRTAALTALLVAAVVAAFVVVGTYVPRGAHGVASALVPLALAVVPAAVAALLVVRPWWGVVIWILLIPVLNLARAQVSVGSIQLIITTALLVALAVGVALEWGRGRSANLRPAAAGLVAVSLVVLLAAASAAVSPTRSDSATIALHGVIEPALLGGLVLVLRPAPRQLAALALAMGASVVLATLINLPRFAAVYGFAFEAQRIYLARLTYYNVGIFGEMLVMALPLVLVGLAWPEWPRRVAAAWPRALVAIVVTLGLAALALAIYLTYSKSAWIAALLVGCLLVFVEFRALRWRVAGLAAIFLISALLIPYPLLLERAVGGGASAAPAASAPAGQGAIAQSSPTPSPAPTSTPPLTDRTNSFDPTSAEGEMSITERFLATKAALRMSLDHPLFGVGPGRFPTEYGTAYHDPQATLVLQSAHDLVPELAAEFGLVLAALFVAVVGVALVLALVMARRSAPLVRLLAALLGASLFGFMVVATLYGVDLYRPYRVMNSDVLFAALLLVSIEALYAARHDPDQEGQEHARRYGINP